MSPVAAEWLIVAGGVHSLAFAAFHMAFWRLFDWRRSLATANRADRAILQILNLRLIYVFLCMAALCFGFTTQLHATALGRAILAGMSLFWVGRTIEQFIFLRIDRVLVHVLTALFVVGAALFALPLLA